MLTAVRTSYSRGVKSILIKLEKVNLVSMNFFDVPAAQLCLRFDCSAIYVEYQLIIFVLDRVFSVSCDAVFELSSLLNIRFQYPRNIFT